MQILVRLSWFDFAARADLYSELLIIVLCGVSHVSIRRLDGFLVFDELEGGFGLENALHFEGFLLDIHR